MDGGHYHGNGSGGKCNASPSQGFPQLQQCLVTGHSSIHPREYTTETECVFLQALVLESDSGFDVLYGPFSWSIVFKAGCFIPKGGRVSKVNLTD